MTRLGQLDVPDYVACVIRTEAQRQGCPEYLAVGIAGAESGWDPNAVGDNGRSIGLFQLYLDGGQGSDYRDNPDALKDPKLNARIAIRPITVAAYAATIAGYAGERFIREVARRSGHPGFVALDDSRLTSIVGYCVQLITDASGRIVPWPQLDLRQCADVPSPPPPLDGWSEGPVPISTDQKIDAIERHAQRINELAQQVG